MLSFCSRIAHVPTTMSSIRCAIFIRYAFLSNLLIICSLALVFLAYPKYPSITFQTHLLSIEPPHYQPNITNQLPKKDDHHPLQSITEEHNTKKNRTVANSKANTKCDIFEGKWVKDENMPYYPAGSCPYISSKFDCHLNGRRDNGYVKWRWQPKKCHIPRFDGTDFLERMRGKRVIFMGDSMNRSMMQSLVCMLRASLSNTSRVYVDRNKEFEARGYYSFIFEDYKFSLDHYQSPFLVKRVYEGSKEVNLRLDVMDEGTPAIRKSDVAIFNTGHWWNNEKTQGGKNYYQEGNYVHPQLDHMKAFTKALKTWGKWIDHNIDHNKTQVFFHGITSTHYRGGQWNSGGKCHGETKPILKESFLQEYPKQMRIFEKVSKAMRTPVVYLNTTKLTDFRKDAHVSIYYLERMSPEKEVKSLGLQDCGHWCMPGVPDAWNELLYYSLIMSGRV